MKMVRERGHSPNLFGVMAGEMVNIPGGRWWAVHTVAVPTAQAGSAEGQKELGCSQRREASGVSTVTDRWMVAVGHLGTERSHMGRIWLRASFATWGFLQAFLSPAISKNVVLKDIAKCCMYSSLVSAKCSYLFSSDPSKHQNKVWKARPCLCAAYQLHFVT